MTSATAPTTEPLEITLNQTEREHLAAAAEHYCKHLEKLASAANDMGRTQEGARYNEEATRIFEELVVPVNDGQQVTFYPHHMAVLEKGCMFLATRMNAAKGTLKGFRTYGKTIDNLKTDAKHALDTLSVQFTPIMAGQAAEGGEE